MTGSIRFRRARVTRPVAAALATVLLALSFSGGFQRGDHDDLEWLPERFHHHDDQWGLEPSGAPLALVDHCLACLVSRTIVRFAPPVLSLPEAQDAVNASAPRFPNAAPASAAFPRTPRAPPAS
jgi:hypothetical protein